MAENQASDAVVRLTSARNIQEAQLWQQALEEAGIESHIVGEYLSEIGLGVAPGAYPELWVHRDDLDRARAILEDLHNAAGSSS